MVPADGPHAEAGNGKFSRQADGGCGGSLSKDFTHVLLEHTQSDLCHQQFGKIMDFMKVILVFLEAEAVITA